MIRLRFLLVLIFGVYCAYCKASYGRNHDQSHSQDIIEHGEGAYHSSEESDEEQNLTNWDYQHQDDWPGECQNGRLQSPINVELSMAKVLHNTQLLEFSKSYSEDQKATIRNNGYSVRLELSPGQEPKPTVAGADLPGTYIFDNVHFHWKSEHKLNNNRYALEAHFVHYNSKFASRQAATGKPDGLLVLAVLYKKGFHHRNDHLNKIIEKIPSISKNWSKSEPLYKKIRLIDLFPTKRSTFYRYTGSLTTPQCTGNVEWIVFTHPSFVAQEQIADLTSIYQTSGKPLVVNYRMLQKLNKRPVYLYGQYCSDGHC